MRKDTASLLNELNARFYSTVHQSFSETRTNAWPGWERLLSLSAFDLDGAPLDRPLRLLDVACGNLRFEKFLRARVDGELELYAVDNCPQLVPADVSARYSELDVVEALLDPSVSLRQSFESALPDAPGTYDVAVSFGFMHHIPSFERRLLFLETLAGMVAEGGYVVVSLWRFLESEKLTAKAASSYEGAKSYFGKLLGNSAAQSMFDDLELNDWFLGWSDTNDVYRYCHHFDDGEVARLVNGIDGRLRLLDDFLADGKTGALNRYLVFRK